MMLATQTVTSEKQELIESALTYESYAANYLKIKDVHGQIIPFILNHVQRLYRAEKEKARKLGFQKYIVLKSRKPGITTNEQGESFYECSTETGRKHITLAQDSESTEEIFQIAQLFYDGLPNYVKPYRQYSNKRKLVFPKLHSDFSVMTAGSRIKGRGLTVQKIHGCEIAQWDKNNPDLDSFLAGLFEAVRYGETVFESTPDGVGNWFHRTWREAKQGLNNWYPIFLPWFVDPQNVRPFKSDEERIKFQEALSPKEVEIMIRFNLTLEQMHFRSWKMADLKSKNQGVNLFPQEYPMDDVSCFLTSGYHRFDLEMLQNLLMHCDKPTETKETGEVTIWEEPDPEATYVSGWDVGEGLPGGDFSGVGILNRETGNQAASLHGIMKPEVLAKRGAALCAKYNKALAAVEANNHGHSTLNTLVNTLHYPNLYYHRDYDSTGGVKLGWQTNGKTRPILLDELDEALRDRLMQVNDEEFISECMTFADNGTGKYEAQPGFYDDRVIKWAIAWQARKMPKFDVMVI